MRRLLLLGTVVTLLYAGEAAALKPCLPSCHDPLSGGPSCSERASFVAVGTIVNVKQRTIVMMGHPFHFADFDFVIERYEKGGGPRAPHRVASHTVYCFHDDRVLTDPKGKWRLYAADALGTQRVRYWHFEKVGAASSASGTPPPPPSATATATPSASAPAPSKTTAPSPSVPPPPGSTPPPATAPPAPSPAGSPSSPGPPPSPPSRCACELVAPVSSGQAWWALGGALLGVARHRRDRRTRHQIGHLGGSPAREPVG